MKLILSKKINTGLVCFFLYLSFCFNEFYLARGNLAYAITSMTGLYGSGMVSNIIFAFLFGGAVPFAIYELITSFLLRSIRVRLGAASDDIRYSLRYFYIAANLITGLLSLLYFINPIISVYGTVLIPFLVTSLFGVLFIMFVFKHYVPNDRRATVLMYLGGFYIVFGAVTTLLSMLGVV